MNYPSLYRDRNSLAEILAQLKTQIDPALLTKKEGEEEDEAKNNTGGEGSVISTRLVTPIMLSVICCLLTNIFMILILHELSNLPGIGSILSKVNNLFP